MTTIALSAALIVAIAIIAVQWRRHRKDISKVAFLFNAIDNGDYSFHFTTKGKGDRQLNSSLNRIKEILQHARDEQIDHERYYELILNQVDAGILVVDTDRGLVMRANKAARQMLGRETITHISQVQQQLKAFSVRETYSELKGKRVRIISFSDIHGELANQEVDAWVKLTRVLTHEIMNSVTPIISIAQALTPHTEGKTRDGLETIGQTSKELMAFVENYRKFTSMPKPEPNLFYVRPFLDRMGRIATEWLNEGCIIDVEVEPKDLLVYADEALLSRVMSNLLKNAVEATPTDGHIIIKAYTNRQDSVVVEVADNGTPIADDVAPQIFTPFFTTKKGGNGIGLSVSRQIMRSMGGMLELVQTGNITTFRLTFI